MSTIQQLFGLDGKTALVTGGTRGIGQAMAIALAESGADVLLVQRDESNKTTKEAIEALGRKATIYTADLASQESVNALIPKILKDGHTIDVLLNCGGIQRRHPSHQFPDNDWNDVLQVNLSTVFTLCREVGAHMLARDADSHGRRGSIINVASLLSFQGGLTVPAYAASKGGVAQLTKALSNEWASKGICVNAIAPGYIATEMNTALMNDEKRAESILSRIPAGRWGNPDDFKGSVVFLASRASGLVILQSFSGTKKMNDPISAYRHWKGIDANEANFRRVCRYYEAHAEDASKIIFQLRKTRMNIVIFVHRRVPMQEFKALFHRFFTTKRSETVVRNENVEIRVDERGGGEEQVGDWEDPGNMHPDYKVLDANETHVEHLCRIYDAKAEDQSWMFYRFRPSSMSIYIIVHKRVPLQEFKTLLEEFCQQSSEGDVFGNEDVEIRIRDRGDSGQDCLGDWQADDSEDPDDKGVEVDGR
ncbi:hypothetical protein Q7P36_011495 [Cladosporium allicinum]